MFKIKKDRTELLEKTLEELESLNYAEQFLDLMPDFFSSLLPVSSLSAFFLKSDDTTFAPYLPEKKAHLPASLKPVDWDSNLVVYLKNSAKTLVLKDEKESRIRFFKKTNPDLFDSLDVDIAIPLMSLKKLYGFVLLEADSRTYRELEDIEVFFRIFSSIIVPMIVGERSQVENNRNYYRIYRMDRLAMVGELAASASHEIKNPLAGISTFLRYFTELKDFKKKDIIDELKVMKDSVQRIDEIVKSLLSFSRYKKRKITTVSLNDVIDASLNAMALKIPSGIRVVKNSEDELMVETDFQQFQQVLINILFNAAEAVDKENGEIIITTSVSGRDQFPSKEMFNIAIKDNGPGIDDDFKEKLFQPFQSTKEEGTGLGLYTCYGLMKSLGGSIRINSSGSGTEVILSLPFSFDDEAPGDE
jgi:signal transduction histidine kinase